jgi:hypothetical protein
MGNLILREIQIWQNISQFSKTYRYVMISKQQYSHRHDVMTALYGLDSRLTTVVQS